MAENPEQPGGKKLGTLQSDTSNSATRTNEYSNTQQTRAGTTKMKFAPKIQPRKKPVEVKQESAESSTRGRGRGRGRGDASRGRGGGRGEVQMTASGPFAMGPSKNAGMGRARSSAAATGRTIGGNRQAMQKDASQLSGGKPSVLAGDRGATIKDEPEQYSENEDEGMEIIDIQRVGELDQNAPTTIPREHYKYETKKDKKKKKDVKFNVKSEQKDKDGDDKMQEDEDDDMEQADVEDIAEGGLDLSESEEEDETEDVAHDFTVGLEGEEDQLLFFQFPKTFPKFAGPPKQANTDKKVSFADEDDKKESSESDKMDVKEESKPDVKPDVKPDLSEVDQTGHDDDAEGEIGELLVYEDGQVKMHVGNGIVFDMNRATQPSFVQHVVSIDDHHRQMSVLGEVGLRYSATLDINRLIEQMFLDEQKQREEQEAADAAKRGA
ncbi:hypothetical protein E3Q12_02302 [Wallemia mellicola]|nr:hypothetical protein E3Q12_02302 [Wallemia mellicola]